MRKQNTKCIHCGYTWNYKGKLKFATCPSCHRNTPSYNLKRSERMNKKPKEFFCPYINKTITHKRCELFEDCIECIEYAKYNEPDYDEDNIRIENKT